MDGRQQLRIQIIDDELPIARTLSDFLTSLGNKCEVFCNPIQAVEEYKREKYDVVITDLRMPGLDGIQVLDRIISGRPEALVIAMTGYADTDSAVACLDRGAYAYFRKPLDLRRLLNTLKRAESELLESGG